MSRIVSVLLTLLVAVGLAALPAPDRGARATTGSGQGELDLHIVLLTDPPLATYAGGVDGLVPTAPRVTGARKLDADRPASRAYRTHLAERQDAFLAAAEALLGRSLEVDLRFDAAVNGLSVWLTPEEAQAVRSLPAVRHVERNELLELHTDVGPRWIGAGAVWDGSASPGVAGNMGEGVVVGIIDTGVNYRHESFAAIGPVDGHVHENPKGRYFGECDPITGLPYCNNKLIGMWDFSSGASPDDTHGHGSHVASTVAGNVVDAEMHAPTTTVEARISGVAPHANIIGYTACTYAIAVGTCPVNGTVGSIDQAVRDGVDVINFSIGGGARDPWTSSIAQAFFGARAAGIFVATSAGNSGPDDGTVGNPANAPWITTVGAATHNRAFVNSLVDMQGGETTPPGDIVGKSVTAGYGPERIVYAGDYGDPLCGTPFPPGTWDGEIVVCDRGIHPRVTKADMVRAGGAGGYVLANDESSGDSIVADPYSIPGVHITYEDGVVLKEWIEAGGGRDHEGTGVITGTELDVDPAHGDVTASFSSRGPNTPVPSVLKPDVTAPGVDVLAAWIPVATPLGPSDFNVISGTSMSSPHTAGAATLMRALHPDWSPDEVRSALMTTAYTRPPGAGDEVQPVLDDDGETPATPFEYGAGRVELRRAANAGLVLDVTSGAYENANPRDGGDPSTLNLASFAQHECERTCAWSRTVKSTQDADVTWVASVETPAGMGLSVEPRRFTLRAGGTQTVRVSADVRFLPPEVWEFARIVLTPLAEDGQSPHATIPVAEFPVAVRPVGEAIVDPRAVLHFHGNEHDGCTGDGASDVADESTPCPELRDDAQLDPAAEPASWGPVSPHRNGSGDRNTTDPNWTWWLDEPVEIAGVMTVEWWGECGGCADGIPGGNADWYLRLFADGEEAYEARVRATPESAGEPSRLVASVTIDEPIAAEERVVLQVDPVFFDTQQDSYVYYDAEAPCPGQDQGPCDSLVRLPVVRENNPPVATDVEVFAETGIPRVVHVLDHAVDPDGEEIRVDAVVAAPANGTATVTADATAVTYTSADGFTGEDTFTFRVADERDGTAVATATVRVHESGDLSHACPEDRVADSGMEDARGNTHEHAIDCIIWWEVSEGRSDTSYAPRMRTNRAQMASFIARALEAAGTLLPSDPPNNFSDVEGNTHERRINQLADIGLVEGTGDGRYEPDEPVRRDQMASFLVRAYQYVEGRALPASRDYFTDTGDNFHVDNINRAREAGFTIGAANGDRYTPRQPVRRDQMASFLARMLNRMAQSSHADPPAGGR